MKADAGEGEPRKRGVGRPAVGPAISLRLPPEIIAAIDGALGPREDRSALIREAIRRELERRISLDGSS